MSGHPVYQGTKALSQNQPVAVRIGREIFLSAYQQVFASPSDFATSQRHACLFMMLMGR